MKAQSIGLCFIKRKKLRVKLEIVSMITVGKRLPDTQGEDRMRER
jgi:hypothetical protein